MEKIAEIIELIVNTIFDSVVDAIASISRPRTKQLVYAFIISLALTIVDSIFYYTKIYEVCHPITWLTSTVILLILLIISRSTVTGYVDKLVNIKKKGKELNGNE